MDIEGLGVKLIDQLVAKDWVRTVADLYKLKRADVASLDKMGELSADNLLKAITASSKPTLPRFIYALGIREVGEVTAQLLASRFGSLEKLMAADAATLGDVKGIGDVTAQWVHAFFADSKNQAVIAALRDAGVIISESAAPQTELSLANQSYVISGTLSKPRAQIKQLLARHGAKVTSQVSKKTTALIVGANPGSKLAAAQQLGVDVLDEAQLWQKLPADS